MAGVGFDIHFCGNKDDENIKIPENKKKKCLKLAFSNGLSLIINERNRKRRTQVKQHIELDGMTN